MKVIYKRGFTMIELLVVIAIIGVLAAVMLAGFNPMKQLRRARDTGRMADLKAIASAQEQYYSDDNFAYSDIGDGGVACGSVGSLAGYMNVIPTSSSDAYPYKCRMNDDDTSFCIHVELQETQGNCRYCGCSGTDLCTMNIGATPDLNDNFCVVQQQ